MWSVTEIHQEGDVSLRVEHDPGERFLWIGFHGPDGRACFGVPIAEALAILTDGVHQCVRVIGGDPTITVRQAEDCLAALKKEKGGCSDVGI
jgi:hypothetical protein